VWRGRRALTLTLTLLLLLLLLLLLRGWMMLGRAPSDELVQMMTDDDDARDVRMRLPPTPRAMIWHELFWMGRDARG